MNPVEIPKLKPPDDQSVTTLYLGNLGRGNEPIVTEADIRQVSESHLHIYLAENYAPG